MISPDFDWEAEGYRLGASLHAHHAVIVMGSQPAETALVAIGIARAQSALRRVALGDLLGDAAPIRRLIGAPDDAHGIVDSFAYGVSFNRIARQVRGYDDLFVLPTGTEPPDYEDLLASRRWGYFIAGFAEAGTLLVLAVPAGARNVEKLVELADGAVVVGEIVPPEVPFSRIIARLDPPRVALPTELPAPEAPRTSRFSKRTLSMAAGVALTLSLAGASYWFASRPFADSPRPGVRLDSTARRETLARTLDTNRAIDSLSGSVAPAASAIDAPAPANPADSLAAVGYTVVLESNNTIAGALFRQRKDAGVLPAATYVPVLVEGSLWYQTRVGAFPAASQADSLLQALRRSGRFGDSLSGRVVRAPYAFLLVSAVPLTAARAVIEQHASRDEPVYGLRQRDGSVRVYLGAFESPQEAMPLADTLRARGIVAPLVFRTGRVF